MKNFVKHVYTPNTLYLTFPAPCISESCIKIKINFYFINFSFSHFFVVHFFMKAFKAFIKPFEAPQRRVETRILSLRPELAREGLTVHGNHIKINSPISYFIIPCSIGAIIF